METRNKFDKYQFRPIDYEIQKKEAKTLFVGVGEELAGKPNVLKIIYYLNGEPAIYIVGGE